MKSAWKTKLAVSLMAVLVATLMVLASPAHAAKLAGTSVKIGVLVPFTGFLADQGWLQKYALEVAQDEINAAGGIGGVPVELPMYDTQTKPEEAINLVRKVATSDKGLAIIGPFTSTECEMAFPVANRFKIAAISASSAAPGIAAKNRPWAFRVSLPSDKSLEPTVRKWKEMYGIKTAAVIYDASEALFKAEGTIIFPKLLKDNGIQVVDSVTFVKADIDYSAQVTRIKAANPDGLVLATSYNAGANITRQARQQGFTKPIVGSTANMAPDYIRIAGASGEGTIAVAGAWEDNPDPRVQNFIKKFLVKSKGKRLDNSAWYVYDVIYMLKQVIESSGVTNKPEDLEADRAKIRDAFATIKDYPGVSGKITVRPDGDSDKEIYVVQVKDGKWVVVR